MAAIPKLIKAVLTAFNASPLLNSVNGGLHYQRVKQVVLTSQAVEAQIGATIYGILNIESGNKEFTSGNSLEDYEISIQIYSGQVVADAAAIQDHLDAMLSWQSLSQVTVVHLMPMGEALVKADLEVAAKDVLVAEASWLCKLQITR